MQKYAIIKMHPFVCYKWQNIWWNIKIPTLKKKLTRFKIKKILFLIINNIQMYYSKQLHGVLNFSKLNNLLLDLNNIF